MRKSLLLLFGVAMVARAETYPAVEHYKITYRVDPAKAILNADADVRVRNATEQPMRAIPVVLYRLLDVTAATDAAGKPLAFTQNVVRAPDEPAWQVNAIEVSLPEALPPGKSATIHLQYGGYVFGYPEVMAYVRERISETYSLLRHESIPYPLIGPPTFAAWRHAYRDEFDSEVDTVVPEGYIAVCSGTDRGDPQIANGKATYRCASDASLHEIDVAIAKFRVFDNADHTLRVYAMPEDAEAGSRVIAEMTRALDLYRSYLGDMFKGNLTLIEIPSGWGSYGLRGHIFQAAATFKDPSNVNELYHEVAHIWNAVAADSVKRTRYFDEAFATYFEAFAVKQFEGDDAFRKRMEESRQAFIRLAQRDPRGMTTPIAGYGKLELGDFAYSKGAWSLYVLQQLLGEDAFRKAMRDFLAAYARTPADFDAFRASLEKSSGRNLQAWFDAWINGIDTSKMLAEGKSVEEMTAAVRTQH